MSDTTLKLILLSLFFYALGVATLAIIGFKRTHLPWIGGYTLAVLGIAWFTQLKWLLLGGIIDLAVYGVMSLLATFWGFKW